MKHVYIKTQNGHIQMVQFEHGTNETLIKEVIDKDYPDHKGLVTRDKERFYNKDTHYLDIIDNQLKSLKLDEKISLQNVKNTTIEIIKNYGASLQINTFYLNDTPCWIPYLDRQKIRWRLDHGEHLLEDHIQTLIGDKVYTIKKDHMYEILLKIETYATRCYNATIKHIDTVRGFSLIEQVIDYDYKTRYPEKVTIVLNI